MKIIGKKCYKHFILEDASIIELQSDLTEDLGIKIGEIFISYYDYDSQNLSAKKRENDIIKDEIANAIYNII